MVDVFEKITGKIIELLETGTVPWRQPWSGAVPTNLFSMKPYNGINFLMLGCMGFESNYWLTFKQAQKLGGGVKAGAKSPAFVVYTDHWESKKKRSDGTEEIVRAGEVYYWPPGHTVWVDEDYEAVEFSPAGPMGQVIDHLKSKLTA